MLSVWNRSQIHRGLIVFHFFVCYYFISNSKKRTFLFCFVLVFFSVPFQKKPIFLAVSIQWNEVYDCCCCCLNSLRARMDSESNRSFRNAVAIAVVRNFYAFLAMQHSLARSLIGVVAVVSVVWCISSFSSNLCIISCISVMLCMRSIFEHCVCVWVPFSDYSTSISKNNWCVKCWNVLFGVCCLFMLFSFEINVNACTRTHAHWLGMEVDKKSPAHPFDLLFSLVVFFLLSPRF